MFIGSKEIISVEDDGDIKRVMLEGEQTARIHKDLYEKIISEVKGEGDVTDIVRDYLARKVLAELAYLDLEFYMVEGVGTALQVLAHNLREEQIGKKFGCKSSYNIPLKELV